MTSLQFVYKHLQFVNLQQVHEWTKSSIRTSYAENAKDALEEQPCWRTDQASVYIQLSTRNKWVTAQGHTICLRQGYRGNGYALLRPP